MQTGLTSLTSSGGWWLLRLMDCTYRKVFSLGSINGKALQISLHSSGLIETNFSPLIRQSAPGSSVTSYQFEAALHYRSYTEEEHREANQIIGPLQDLLDLTEDKMSIEQYHARETIPYVSSTEKLLEHLGINPVKAFAINGV